MSGSRLLAGLLLLSAQLTSLALAQIVPPNEYRVAMGHLHFEVDDIAASRAFWMRLGGVEVDTAQGQAIAFPGLVILIDRRDTERSPAQPIDHVAFRVVSLDALTDAGLELQLLEDYPGIATVSAPAGESVELFEEGTATNVGFDSDVATEMSERHNRPLLYRIESHHLHFYLPEVEVVAARDWYVEHFGAVPGMRWRYEAADLPGMNLNFSTSQGGGVEQLTSPLDHIGFEVSDLEAFCQQLLREGVVFDVPYTRVHDDYALASLTDPWGTRIELTEGLMMPR